ncbi:hypothetical protein BT96DRAFT_1001066 [Gymnopus androsaceus JB14]|uniref:Uncharacterized protein n=1 Tax=Gymnopus androsaceus JB14 TaxID=1447944 RepID=A0A6A4H2Z1_9AGAR|nr:hypothetical protein BT96DRAFT_1001066 [Gymnopus androsaceus JB14]
MPSRIPSSDSMPSLTANSPPSYYSHENPSSRSDPYLDPSFFTVCSACAPGTECERCQCIRRPVNVIRQLQRSLGVAEHDNAMSGFIIEQQLDDLHSLSNNVVRLLTSVVNSHLTHLLREIFRAMEATLLQN